MGLGGVANSCLNKIDLGLNSSYMCCSIDIIDYVVYNIYGYSAYTSFYHHGKDYALAASNCKDLGSLNYGNGGKHQYTRHLCHVTLQWHIFNCMLQLMEGDCTGGHKEVYGCETADSIKNYYSTIPYRQSMYMLLLLIMVA